MTALLVTVCASLLLAACNGSGTPAAISGTDWPAWNHPVYRIDPQAPEDRPLVVKQPYELEAPGNPAWERGHDNSIRLYGPGVSRRRQTLV